MELDALLTFYFAALGLIVGSYLNVVIHRLPRGQDTVFDRSGCPYCGRQIRARDNVPVLSFLLLGGRCRDCRSPIAWRYPLVEAITGALFALGYQRFGLHGSLAVALVFVAGMIVLAGIDYDHLILPDRLTWPGIALGLGLHLTLPAWLPWATVGDALLGALLGGLVPLAIYGLWWWLRRVEGLGLGDVKILALVGAFLGWKGVAVTYLLASLSAALVAVTGILLWRRRRMHKLPFGPYLAAGAVVALFFGPDLVRWYAGLLAVP